MPIAKNDSAFPLSYKTYLSSWTLGFLSQMIFVSPIVRMLTLVWLVRDLVNGHVKQPNYRQEKWTQYTNIHIRRFAKI